MHQKDVWLHPWLEMLSAMYRGRNPVAFTTKPELENAGFIVEEDSVTVSLIGYFQDALEAIGCTKIREADVMWYFFDGNVVAAIKRSYDTPDGQYPEHEESVVWEVFRLDLDKQFANTFRGKLIELVLPNYFDEFVEDRYAGSTADAPDLLSPRHERLVLRCLDHVLAVLDPR